MDTYNSVDKDTNETMLNHTSEDPEELENLQLKDNMLPWGLVQLEELFGFNDVAKKPKIEPVGAKVEDCNIGTEESPKIVKLSNSLLPEEKQKYINLLKEYSDVFAWG